MDLLTPPAPRNWLRMIGAGLRLGVRAYPTVFLIHALVQFAAVALWLLAGQLGAALGGPAMAALPALVALLAAFAACIAYAACAQYVWDAGRGRGADWRAALAAAPRAGWPVLVVALLTGLAALLGALLVVLPGLVLLVALSLGLPLAVVERRRPAEALDESWRLVAGHWWRTLATQLFVLGPTFGLAVAAGKLAPLGASLLAANALPLLVAPFAYGLQLALLGELATRAAAETPVEAQRRASSFA